MSFYKIDGETLHVADDYLTGPSFELSAANHLQFTYPVDGWYWFDTLKQAVTFFADAPPTITTWYMDIGPFFDRFGMLKLVVLSSSDPIIQAIVKDCQSRKWIDLQRPDVGQALDVIVSKNIGVTTALKTSILTTPVTKAENMAVCKLYFS